MDVNLSVVIADLQAFRALCVAYEHSSPRSRLLGQAHKIGSCYEVVARWFQEGALKDVYLKADRSGPILVLNDTDTAGAQKRMADLPFVVHGVATFDCHNRAGEFLTRRGSGFRAQFLLGEPHARWAGQVREVP